MATGYSIPCPLLQKLVVKVVGKEGPDLIVKFEVVEDRPGVLTSVKAVWIADGDGRVVDTRDMLKKSEIFALDKSVTRTFLCTYL